MRRRKTSFPSIPIEEMPASAKKADAEPDRPVILVVDDDSTIADSLTEILRKGGYAAIPAYGAEAALETAQVVPPEMVISEVMLRGMNGIELAVTLRRMRPACKVILTSGQSHITEQLAPADCAGKEFVFLAKPVHSRELLQRVSESFGARKSPASSRPPAGSAPSPGSD